MSPLPGRWLPGGSVAEAPLRSVCTEGEATQLVADLRDLQLAGRLPIALATVHDAAKKARRDLEDKATVAGARHVLVSRTVLVECVSPRRDTLRDGADGTRLKGRGSAARLALVAEASPSKSRAWLYPQLSR